MYNSTDSLSIDHFVRGNLGLSGRPLALGILAVLNHERSIQSQQSAGKRAVFLARRACSLPRPPCTSVMMMDWDTVAKKCYKYLEN